MDHSLLVGYASLFWGQTSAWFNLLEMKTEWGRLTTRQFLDHVEGRQELGIYTTNDLGQCYWGCIDIDVPDKLLGYQMALSIRSEYQENGITAWIEASRSKGYHVWVFLHGAVSAFLMRQAQMTILETLGIEKIEVNPKQEKLWNLSSPKTAPITRMFGIGNLVRIPYWPYANPGRMMILDQRGRPLSLSTFVPAALESRTAPSDLLRLAAPHRAIRTEQDGLSAESAASHGGGVGSGRPDNQDAWKVWNGERTIGKGERDNQFYTLAKLLHSHDTLFNEAMQTVRGVYDQQLEDTEDFSLNQALEKVRRVYNR